MCDAPTHRDWRPNATWKVGGELPVRLIRMSELLLYYKRPDPITWVYLSSFLTIGLFFVFHRFWSIRNLDIALLILLAPGLLMVHEGHRRELRAQAARTAAPDPASAANAADGSAGQTAQTPAARDRAADDLAIEPRAAAEAARGAAEESGDGNLAGPDASPLPDSRAAASEGMAAEGMSAGEPPPVTADEAIPADAAAIQRGGFIWLFVVQALILVRLMMDPLMVRRPLLDPNLTTGGLNFLGISLFVFMMANVVASTPRIQEEQGPKLGPGYALMNMLPAIPTRPVSDSLAGGEPPEMSELTPGQRRKTIVAKVLAIIAQMAIVTGIVLIGRHHFGNLRAGTGCALLYLLLPYTAQMTGRVDHAVPAALLLWAVLSYRRPVLSGVFIGLSAGLVYYPLFLLPLWFSFYWQRGARRFGIGVVAMLAILMVLLSVAGTESLVEHLRRMYGLFLPTRAPQGIWELGWNPIWRLPVIVGFVILSFFFAIWPAQKNLGSLISCSAAVMVAAQFWHGYGGGLYIAWFLPLLLLTIFRPNLQDRIALKVIRMTARSIRRTPPPEVEAA